MNKDRAKEILGAFPADAPAPAGDDPEMREALHELERDTELKAWYDRSREFDRAVAGKLREAPAPGALRERILANREPRVISFPALPLRHVAAAVVLLAGLAWGLFSWIDTGENQPPAAQASVNFFGELLTFFDREPEFEYSGDNLDDVCDRVKSRGGPESVDVPPAIKEVNGFRCRLFNWEERRVALFCMQREGRTYHLFVIDEDGSRSADSGQIRPRFTDMNEWSFAAWGDTRRTYILGTRGSRDDLEPLF